MRAVFGLVLLVGLALAGGAVYLAKNYVGQYQSALARERAEREKIVPTVEVYVAERQLKYGERLDPEDLRLVLWPQDAIPEGAFVGAFSIYDEAYETAEDLPEDLARTVLRTMEKDEAILQVKVTEPGEAAGITSQLDRGMRAFAIKVDVASGVSGFLRPGDRVDVYWTGNIRNANERVGGGEVTKLIEAGIRLIAVDQNAAADLDGASIAQTVTVAALPAQVAALAQAQSTGRLSLSLVGAEDDTIAAQVEIDQRRLLGLQEEEKQVQVQEKQVCTIRTRRGSEVVEIPIPCTN